MHWCTICIMILFIFGLPGSGKSFVAEVIKNSFGYTIHNGDDDLPTHMKTALFEKKEITDAMRKEFTHNLIKTVNSLLKISAHIVVHQTLLKTFMRDKLKTAFPDAIFILIQTQKIIREQRYMKRLYFNLGIPYLRIMCAQFEPPNTNYIQIENNDVGEKAVTEQLSQIPLTPINTTTQQ